MDKEKLAGGTMDYAEIIIDAVAKAGADGISAVNTVGPELYIEKSTGEPILHNKKGHKGGKSGEWIKDITLQKIKEIRANLKTTTNVPEVEGLPGISAAERDSVTLSSKEGIDDD